MVKNLTTVGLVLLMVLAASAAPAQDVFYEDWESGTINGAVWFTSSTTGAVRFGVTNAQNNTPGGSYALDSSGITSDPGGDQEDWVETVPSLDTSVVTGQLYLTFFWGDWGGTDGDDWLTVDTSNDGGVTWTEVFVRNNPRVASFQYEVIALPDTDKSANFRLRISMNDSATDEIWEIDDIYVGGMPPFGLGQWSVTRTEANLGYPAAGGPITGQVTLELAEVAAGPETDFYCTETLPADCTNIAVTNVWPVGTASVVGQSVVWQITGGPIPSTGTLSYTCDVAAAACAKNIVADGNFQTAQLGTYPVVAGGGWNKNVGILGMNYDLANGQVEGMQPSDLFSASSLYVDAPNMFNYDVGWDGDPAYPGGTSYYACDDSFTVYGAGSDIWRNGDHFQYMCFAVDGDFEIAADVRMVQPFNDWTKAGIMARQNLGSRAMYFMARMRGNADNRCDAQWRLVENDDASASVNSGNQGAGNKFPTIDRARLTMKREGTSFTLGWADLDGPTSQPLGTWIQFTHDNMPNRILLGFATTSHNNGQVAWTRYSNIETTMTVSSYAPMVGTPTRSFSVTNYDPGTPFTVTLDVPHTSDGTTVTLVENVPDGAIISNISGGGVLSGNTITWTYGSWAAPGATETYDCEVKLPLRPVHFLGGYAQDEMLFTQNTPDSSLLPTGAIMAFQDGILPDPTYVGCQDTGILFYQSNNNDGGDNINEEGDWRGTGDGNGLDDHKKLLVKFDLSSVPDTTVINGAILGTWMNDERRADYRDAHDLSVYPILKQWNEGRGTGNDGNAAQGDEVTYNDANTTGAGAWVPWEIAGAMGNSDVGPLETTTPWDAGWPEWVLHDVTASVQSMIATAGPDDDQGWKISQDKVRGQADDQAGNEYTATGAYQMWSSNHANVERRPYLLLLDGTQYVPSIGTAVRSAVGGTYTWGMPLTVNLDIQNLGPAPTLTVFEPLPDDITSASIGSISNGGTVDNTGITWTIAGFNANLTLSYTVTVPESYLAMYRYAFKPLQFNAGMAADNAGYEVAIAESAVLHSNTLVWQDNAFQADIVDPTYTGTQDAQIITYRKDVNVGGGDLVEQGDWDGGLGDHKKVLIKFVPGGQGTPGITVPTDIADAKLLLYANSERRAGFRNAHFIRAWRLLKDWQQGTGPYSDGDPNRGNNGALANEVTWNNANAGADTGTTIPWEIPGAMGVTDVGTSEPETLSWANYPEWIALDVTATVREMATDGDFFGWKVCQDVLSGVADDTVGNEYKQGAYAYRSSENADVRHRPMLVIRLATAVPVNVSKFEIH